MRSLTTYTSSLFCLILFSLLAVSTAKAQVPYIEAAGECHVSLDAAFQNDVECGWLVVPEVRDGAGSATVRLAYAVARAESADAEPDPIIFIRGGPGLSNISIMNRELGRAPWKELRQHRDLLFLDVRGTGYSQPAVCPAINDVWFETDYLVVSDEEFNRDLARAASVCADAMAAEGRSFGAYNATSVARDLDDLRRLLGYDRWNVFGWSYGGRYAQALMSHNPDAIRAVVLSAPSPMGSAPMSRTVALQEALDLVFSQCAADAACNAAFPDLERQFIALMERLEAEPARFEVPASTGVPNGHFIVNRRAALRHIQMELYGEQLPPVLPLLISEAANGNLEALLAFLPSESARWGTNQYAEGLALATICHDDAGKPDTTQHASVRSTHPHLAYTAWYWARLDVCDSVHDARASEREWAPPEAPIPTLVLGGGHDPTVAPSSIRNTAQVLPNAQIVMGPALGHIGAHSNPCMSGLTTSFYENPQATLDTTCLANYGSISFVTDIRRVRGSARLNTWFTGILAYTPTAPRESTASMTWVEVSLLGLLSALLIWPAAWLWRRIRGSTSTRSTEEVRAVWLAAATALFGILVFLLSIFVMGLTANINHRVLAVGVLSEFGWVFVLPWVLVALTLALTIAAVIAWRRKYWGRWMRIHYTVVAVSAVSLTLFLGYWGMF